jgi:predicted nucleic acid-binding protein
VARRERKYTLDANLYIRAFRDSAANAELRLFHTAFAPFEYLSAVVVQELRAGARRSAAAEQLERSLCAPFERSGRILAPTYAAWKRSGAVLAALAEREGLDVARVPKGFANDVLLAVTCREAGVTLVTANRRDFERIARVAPFEFVAPWPAPTS